MIRALVLAMVVQLGVASTCRSEELKWGAAPEVERDPENDWAREPSSDAKARIAHRVTEFKCGDLKHYISVNDPMAAYFAIRDAALFGDGTCNEFLSTLEPVLREKHATDLALLFYQAKRGGQHALSKLLMRFDADAIDSAGKAQDDFTVELFGFFPDWDKTGRRLLRHEMHADGAVSEVNASALEWKRVLFGAAPNYGVECLKVAREEAAKYESAIDIELLCGVRRGQKKVR